MAIRPDYYILNQTLVDPDVAMKHREIISESAIESPNGCRLFTVTFKQVLQDLVFVTGMVVTILIRSL